MAGVTCSVVRTHGSGLVLLGSGSYIHWVGYWFSFGVLCVVFSCLLLYVYVHYVCIINLIYCCFDRKSVHCTEYTTGCKS
jgi:hypothetical protein